MLIRHLRSALPGCMIQLRTVHQPATMSPTLFRDMPRVLGAAADLVIEDYTINDQRGKVVVRGRINDSVALRNIIGAHEYTAQKLRARRTALIMTEAYPNFHSPLRCQPHVEHAHMAVARAYSLAVLSFMRAVCNESATATGSSWPAEQHWRAGCGAYDKEGLDCMPHPGPHTHRIYASLLAVHILREAVRAAHTAPAEGGVGADARLPALSEPPLAKGSGPFVLSASDLEQMRGCVTPISTIDARKNCALPTLGGRRVVKGSAQGWSCFEDRPGKPGWIANSTSDRTPRTLIIPVRGTHNGYLVVGYLKSYEGMGRASLFVGGDKSRAVTLDGRWGEGTSQTQFESIPLHKLVYQNVTHPVLGSGHHPSSHKVHVQVPALEDEASDSTEPVGKFKLVFVSTC